MKKIRITSVDPRTKTKQGLFGDGCYGSDCYSECCEFGCDVDLATLKVIERYKEEVESLVGAKLEDCFSTKLKEDDDYIGGAYRETAVRKKDKTCALRLKDQKGCSLFYLWAVKKAPKRIVPTICRVYPITWHRGKLFIDSPIRQGCVCKVKIPKGLKAPSLFETQWKEIKALFDIQEKANKAASPKKTAKKAVKKTSAKKGARAAKKK